MSAQELADKIMAAQRAARLAARSSTWVPSMTPATDLGYACERRIVYHQVAPELQNPISEELASIFTEGNLHQANVRRELSSLGFEVLEAERNFRDERLRITGTIDGMIAASDEHRAQRIPVEIKSYFGDGPKDAESWKNSESALLRRYYSQLQAYLILTATPEGLGLFKNKQTGLWTVVAVPLDYEHAEGLLSKAERVRDAVAAFKKEQNHGTLPARLLDRSECSTCPWRESACNPAEAEADPMLLVSDPDLISRLQQRESSEASAKLFDVLDKGIKDQFKLTKGDRFVVGGSDGWTVTKKPHGNGTRIIIERMRNAVGGGVDGNS